MASGISAKRLKNEKHEEDQLSQLPDEILVSILSLITYREAARTSVLSRRWKKVWTFITVLNFDGSSTLLHIEEQPDWELKWKEFHLQRSKYVDCVNGALDSYQRLTVEEFRVRFDLDLDYKNDIHRWVSFAFDKKVQRLVMDLRDYQDDVQMEPFCFSLLGLPDCSFLKVVQFMGVNISGEDLQYLLSTCSSLEYLSIENSDLLVHLEVDISLLSLKYLDITDCSNISNIDVSAPNLLTFKFIGDGLTDVNISYEKIPNVTQCYFGSHHSNYILFQNPSPFSNYFTQLETLTLDIYYIKNTATLPEFPELSHLKNLELAIDGLSGDDNLLVFSPLIKSSPLLERFRMKLVFYESYRRSKTERQGPKCIHKNLLKYVKIVGFRGCTIDKAFIECLIEGGVMLEKVIIDPYTRETPRIYLDNNGIKDARDKANLLKDRFGLGDKLLVL